MQDAAVAKADGQPLWRRIVDYPLVTLVIAVGIFTVAYAAAIAIGGSLPPWGDVAGLALQSAITIGLALIAYKLAIRHLGEQPGDDLPWAGAAKGLGIGLALGGALIAAVVAVAAVLDVYNVVGQGTFEALVPTLLAAAIVPAFMEELLFRGILFRWIEAFAGSWIALFVTSALFGLAHIYNPNASWFSSFAIAVEAGVLLGGAYMLTRSLWMPIGLHAAWNFTQGFVFDVPVSGIDGDGLVQARLSGPELLSGGHFGLEASLIALAIATAAGAWLIFQAIRRGLVVPPRWAQAGTVPAGPT